MANEPSKTPTPQPQAVPLSKIHDLPGAVISKQPDKSYGGLVTSIQAGGVKERWYSVCGRTASISSSLATAAAGRVSWRS